MMHLEKCVGIWRCSDTLITTIPEPLWRMDSQCVIIVDLLLLSRPWKKCSLTVGKNVAEREL